MLPPSPDRAARPPRPSRARTRRYAIAATAWWVGLAGSITAAQRAHAQPTPTRAAAAAGSSTMVVAASRRQHMLAARRVGAVVEVRACAAGGGCTPAGGKRFAIAAEALPDSMHSEVVTLANDVRVLLLRFSARDGRGQWSLLVAASPRAEAPAANKLLSGFTDRPRGNSGRQRTSALWIEAGAGGSRITVAQRYDNATVCGRRAWLSAQHLDPTTLSWSAAKSRSLSPAERAAALPLVARRSETRYQSKHIRVLQAQVASSSQEKQRGTINDGRLDTRWAEARPGDGGGEFVTLSALEQLDIAGLRLAFRLPKASPLKGAAPQHFFVATNDKVFRVTMPEDAWQQPLGTAYEVNFPAPLHTDCVALVLDDAYPHEDAPVGIAEVRAHTTFDSLNGDYHALVTKLADPHTANIAKALLLRGGARALKASMTGYTALPRSARSDALTIIDAGDCRATAAFFVDRLLGEGAGADFDPDIDALAGHARSRLRGCPETSIPLLVRAMKKNVGRTRAWAAEQLALMGPGAAARAIPTLLADPQPEVRAQLRKALAIAAKQRAAEPVLTQLLAEPGFRQRPLVARIDILRALGDSITQYPQAGAALTAAIRDGHNFRSQYLLLPAAAHLAAAGDPHATQMCINSMRRHHNPHLRAHAVSLAANVPQLGAALAQSLSDPHPRVRAAALAALGGASQPLSATAAPRVIDLLQHDPWTFVRAQAAHAVAAQPASVQLDKALVEALDDKAWPVRQAALRALGRRHSVASAPNIVDIAQNPKESVDVRAAAIAALGELCHRDSAELLYKLAMRAGYPQLPYDQPLGLAALSALGDIQPPNLALRLAPLLAQDPRIPRVIGAITRDAVGRRGHCH